MHAFLINLDSSPDRLAFMEQQANQAGVTLERFSAVRGLEVRNGEVENSTFAPHLSNGEVGCYASHLHIHRMILDRGLPYALVLEDDVLLDSDFAAVADAAVTVAPAGWDYIHLSSVIKRAVHALKRLGAADRELIVYSRLPVNTAAYIISASGARKFLQPRHRVRPVDMDVRYGWLMDFTVYGVAPPPARQNEVFDSTIWQGTPGAKSKPGSVYAPGLLSQLQGALWQANKLGWGVWLSLAAANALRPVKRKKR